MFYAGRDFLRQLNIAEILQFNRYSHRSAILSNGG
jgi:hypothetical protein